VENIDVAGDILAMGTLEGPQTGYVRDPNTWHKVFWRKSLSMDARLPTVLMCISRCRMKTGTSQIFNMPLDAAPVCADCDNPAKAPPLCPTCSDPMCMGVHP